MGPTTDPNRVIIFDTTLRDGEQSPGCSMNLGEKLEMARALAALGVKGYRLTEHYREAKFRRVFLTHHELVRKVNSHQEKESRKPLAEVHQHLKMNLHRVELAKDIPDDVDDFRLFLIRDKDFSFTVCKQGRVHTNLTNLPRIFRPYLRVRGQTLVATDVSNSQPLLLAFMLAAQNEAFDAEIQSYRNWLITRSGIPLKEEKAGGEEEERRKKSYLGTYSDSAQSNDIAEFLRLCLEGQIYERFMKLTEYDRPIVKDKFFIPAFGKFFLGNCTLLGKVFQAEFPEFWKALCRFKAKGYQEVARRLQAVESYLVIWRTCTRLMKEYPDAPLLTLHDSLVTDRTHIDAFENALKEEFEFQFGVSPKFKRNEFLAPVKAQLPATGRKGRSPH
jgi:hypothetical protein